MDFFSENGEAGGRFPRKRSRRIAARVPPRRAAVAFERLDRLEMPNCPVLGDENLKSICVHCMLLRHLNIAGCSAVTSTGILAIAQHRTSLLSLNISQVTQADGRAVRAILSQCQELEQFAMNGLHRATDASFVGIFSGRANAAAKANSGSSVSLSLSHHLV